MLRLGELGRGLGLGAGTHVVREEPSVVNRPRQLAVLQGGGRSVRPAVFTELLEFRQRVTKDDWLP